MDAIENGARQAVVNCGKVQPCERVVVITDRHTEHLATAVVKQAEQAGASVTRFLKEDFGPRPDDGSNPLPFPGTIADAQCEAQVSIYVAQCDAGELQSFRKPMLSRIDELGLRQAHMPNFIEKMMSTGMVADYDEIQKISAKVYDIVCKAAVIRVTTPCGTDIKAHYVARYQWIISDGNIRSGNWSSLPDGEVFTAPVGTNGTVVTEGCFGDFFNAKYGDLQDTSQSYELRDARAVRVSSCRDYAEFKEEFERYTFETDENSNRPGEFAIGTNIGLRELIGYLRQDVKFPCIHLALGSPYPDKTGAGWDRWDSRAVRGSVRCDYAELWAEFERYTHRLLLPSRVPHSFLKLNNIMYIPIS